MNRTPPKLSPRQHLVDLKPYSSARDEFHGTASVYLDANENPWPSKYNRYPDPHQNELKQVISKLKGVSPAQIVLGNGSDEIIDLLIRAYCEPGTDEVIIPVPTYGMYGICAAIHNVRVRAPKLSATFDLDRTSLAGEITPKSKVIFLCSPNNPTGNLLDEGSILWLLEMFPGLVVIDEAYIDFASRPGWLPLLSMHPNLVVIQTLSKAWGLAGIRVGIGFGHPEVIGLLSKIKPPYNLGTPAQEAAMHALLQDGHKQRKVVAEILEERSRMSSLLEKLPGVRRVYPSESNFLLVEIRQARKAYEALTQRGIIVRDRSTTPGCTDCLRITIGTPEENKMLAEALTEICS